MVIITKIDLEILKNLDFNKGDLSMIIAMFSWAIYSALLKKDHEISQLALLQMVIFCGLFFLIPICIIEFVGNKITLGKPFYLTLTYVIFFQVYCILFLDQRYFNNWSK